MIFTFDLDGTLCSHEKNYSDANPYLDRIDKVNKLYDAKNTIIIDTARGSTTGINWKEVTEKQLHKWKVKYHHLRTGYKLNSDFFVDDKGINSEDFFVSGKAKISKSDAGILLEDVIDTLIEVDNGITDEMLHEATDKLFKFRDDYFKWKK